MCCTREGETTTRRRLLLLRGESAVSFVQSRGVRNTSKRVSKQFLSQRSLVRGRVTSVRIMASGTSGEKPTLNYFSICGRGELARLICAVGDVEFEDKCWNPSFDESGGWRQGYQSIGTELGFPGTMPILTHGDVKLFQTAAIESYLASISPVFAPLTPAQKGVDMMYAQIKADINASTESLLFKKITPEELTPIAEKWYGILEGLLPDEGFVNGLDFPTIADLAVLVIAKGCMPFQAALTIAGFTWSDKYPKITRVASAAAAFPKVDAFLKASEYGTLKADPFGLMPAEYKDA